MFGGAAPGDIRPSDWYSFAEASGQIAETIQASLMAFGPTAPPQAFGIAPGEQWYEWNLPDISLGQGVLGSGGVAVAAAADITGSIISGMDRNQPTHGSQPGDFEEGGVFADRPAGWVFEGQSWDPYDTPEIPPEEEEQPPIVIPLDAGVGQPDPYEPSEEDEPMPTFWDVVNPVIDVFQGQSPGATPGFLPPGVAAPGTVPSVPTGGATSNMRYNPRTGKWECRRRRRRRLLTESDFNDLMRIATLPNKQNVTVALAKAIGRR